VLQTACNPGSASEATFTASARLGLVSGQAPFSGWGMEQILTSPAQEPAPLRELRPEIPADLEAVIHRCLRRDPEE